MVTRHYLKLEGQMKIAELSRDARSGAALAPQLETAARERSDLRRRIQEHEGMPVADTAKF